MATKNRRDYIMSVIGDFGAAKVRWEMKRLQKEGNFYLLPEERGMEPGSSRK